MSNDEDIILALIDALSVARSVSMADSRKVVIGGCVMYAQTEEWCDWIQDEIIESLEKAIAKATGEIK